MRIRKYVLLLDTKAGELSALAGELKKLDFRVAVVPDKEQAHLFLREFPKLALVVINGARDDHSGLLEEARRLHPGLPLVQVDELGCTVESGGKVWRTEGRPTAAAIEARVRDALLEHCYPDAVLSALNFGIEEAMAGFGSNVISGQVHLKATRGVVGELSALLPFSGDRVTGILAVGTTRATARNLHQRLFPDHVPDEEDLTDLLGEVCNRAIGRFHELCESRGTPFNFGVSLYTTDVTDLRIAQDHPALVIEFEGTAGPVWVELFLDCPIGEAPDLQEEPTHAPAGRFVLI